MDSELEYELLSIIEQNKAILCREGTKEGKQKRLNAWNNIRTSFLTNTGKDLDEPKLKIKWNNIQSRIKEKQRCANITGGGPPAKMSTNDLLAVKILGENNPKICMVPGAKENVEPVSNLLDKSITLLPSTEPCTSASSDTYVTSTKCAKSPRVNLRKSTEELQYDVLILEKEHLQLQMQYLKRKLQVRLDKSTQTETQFSAGFMPIYYND